MLLKACLGFTHRHISGKSNSKTRSKILNCFLILRFLLELAYFLNLNY